VLVTQAREHVLREYAAADGAPAAQALTDGSRSTDATTVVERAATARAELFATLTTIEEALEAVELSVKRLYAVCRKAAHAEMPQLKKCSSDPNLAGYSQPLNEGGWFDPRCEAISRSAAGGQCDKCRKRLERWRKLNERQPLADERTVEYDSHVIMGADGVARVRPSDAA
jgi:hypothetical protein